MDISRMKRLKSMSQSFAEDLQSCIENGKEKTSAILVSRSVLVLCAFILALGIALSGTKTAVARTLAQQDEFVPIYEIQGASTESPVNKQRLDTYGLVTGITATGFYLQDPAGDDELATSDGLFVYTRTRPKVEQGSCVEVIDAFASEFYDKTELSELRARSIQPSARCVGEAVAAVPVPLARLYTDPVALFEQYEGMVVALLPFTGTVTGPTKRFNSGEAEISFVDERLAHFVEGGRIFQWQPENTAAIMYLSNALGGDFPELGWGDEIIVAPMNGGENILAILDYNFGKYQLLLLPGQQVTGTAQPFDDLPAAAATEDDFTVCTFNILGLGRGSAQHPDEDTYNAQLQKRALAIVEELGSCTVIGLQETGAPEDAGNLAELLTNDFGVAYVPLALEGPMTSNREFPLTNSFLVRTDRVDVLNIESRQGCSALSYDVAYTPGACPGREFALFNRPPLVTELLINGAWGEPYGITVINNHWKSKGGDESVNVIRREAQARHVASLVQEKIDADPNARVIVLGDLNDYYESIPINALRTATAPEMIHGYDFLAPLDRYTYNFNGAFQVLDHILITPNLRDDLAGIDPVHINADYPYPLAVDTTSVHHSSDHDPVVMRVRPGGAGWVQGNLRFDDIAVELFDDAGTLVGDTVTDANGDFVLWNVAPGTYTLQYGMPAYLSLPKIEQAITLELGPNEIEQSHPNHQSIDVGAAIGILTAALSAINQ